MNLFNLVKVLNLINLPKLHEPHQPCQGAQPDQPSQAALFDQPCQRVQPPRSSHTSPHQDVQPQQPFCDKEFFINTDSLNLISPPGDSSTDNDDSEV